MRCGLASTQRAMARSGCSALLLPLPSTIEIVGSSGVPRNANHFALPTKFIIHPTNCWTGSIFFSVSACNLERICLILNFNLGDRIDILEQSSWNIRWKLNFVVVNCHESFSGRIVATTANRVVPQRYQPVFINRARRNCRKLRGKREPPCLHLFGERRLLAIETDARPVGRKKKSITNWRFVRVSRLGKIRKPQWNKKKYPVKVRFIHGR